MKTNTLLRSLLTLIVTLSFQTAFAQSSLTSHTVQRGETIESIAAAYQITKEKLIELNPDIAEYFYVGMKLNVPSGNTAVTLPTPQPVDNNVETYMADAAQEQMQATVAEATVQDEEEDRKWSFYYKISYTRNIQKPKHGDDMSLGGYGNEFGFVMFPVKDMPVTIGLGWKSYKRDDKNEYGKTTTDFYNWTVPITIGYMAGSEKVKFGISGGVYADYMSGGKQRYSPKYTRGGDNTTREYKFKDIDGFKRTVYGVKAEARLRVSVFYVFAEYGKGLTKRFEEGEEDFWSIGVGVGF